MVPCRQLAVANRHGQVLGEKKENDALKRVSFWYADTLLNFDIDHSDFSKNGKNHPYMGNCGYNPIYSWCLEGSSQLGYVANNHG